MFFAEESRNIDEAFVAVWRVVQIYGEMVLQCLPHGRERSPSHRALAMYDSAYQRLQAVAGVAHQIARDVVTDRRAQQGSQDLHVQVICGRLREQREWLAAIRVQIEIENRRPVAEYRDGHVIPCYQLRLIPFLARGRRLGLDRYRDRVAWHLEVDADPSANHVAIKKLDLLDASVDPSFALGEQPVDLLGERFDVSKFEKCAAQARRWLGQGLRPSIGPLARSAPTRQNRKERCCDDRADDNPRSRCHGQRRTYLGISDVATVLPTIVG